MPNRVQHYNIFFCIKKYRWYKSNFYICNISVESERARETCSFAEGITINRHLEGAVCEKTFGIKELKFGKIGALVLGME